MVEGFEIHSRHNTKTVTISKPFYYYFGTFTKKVSNGLLDAMKTVQEVRRLNMRRVIDEKCRGKVEKFATEVGYLNPGSIYQYLNGKKAIGSNKARQIEGLYKMGTGWMDTDHEQPLAAKNGAPAMPKNTLRLLRDWESLPGETQKAFASSIHEMAKMVRGSDQAAKSVDEVTDRTTMKPVVSADFVSSKDAHEPGSFDTRNKKGSASEGWVSGNDKSKKTDRKRNTNK